MYQWRELTDKERAEILASRQRSRWPAHSPPRWKQDSPGLFHLTAACYEHAPIIGRDTTRMNAFANDLLAACDAVCVPIAAWCLLPNHYHLLLEATDLRTLTCALGRLHGRTSRAWNLEENSMGRTVFHRVADRNVRSERHFYATLNYVHHNPVRHGYVSQWTEWPWSSAYEYLSTVGREEAARLWRNYPLLDYGKDWDDPLL